MSGKTISRNKLFVLSQSVLLIPLAIATITIILYWPVTHYSFLTYDDAAYVTGNPFVQKGLTLDGLIWAFTSFNVGLWHPLTMLSHMVGCQLFGLDAGRHHLVNVLFHLANTLLLFLVLNRMTGAPGRSGFVAALFALHPLHVESVAWVAERKDVLSTFFWMLTLWGYLQYVEKPNLARYLLVLLLFVLGLMSKPMLVTLPFVLLLLDYWPLGRFPWQSQAKEPGAKPSPPGILQLVGEKIPLLVLSIAASMVTFLAQQKSGAMGTLDAVPLDLRIANALVSYLAYMGKMLWPQHLAVFYPFPLAFPWWQTVGAGLSLIVISGACLWVIKKRPCWAVGWFWYLGTLVPVIGLVQVGVQGMADRYTYIPLLGLFIAIAWGLPALLPKWQHKDLTLSLAAGLIVMAFTVGTWFQIQHWKNSFTLFQHAVAVTTDNYIARVNLGLVLIQEGREDEALSQYGKAIEIGHSVVKPKLLSPHYNMGTILLRRGQLDEAATHFLEVLKIQPDDQDSHYNLGTIFSRQGRLDEAAAHFREVLKIKPDYPEAHYSLATVLSQQEKFDEAAAHFLEVLKLRPEYAEAHLNLGITLARQGKPEKAVTHFSEALKLRPGYAKAHFNFGVILEQQGNLDEARTHFAEAVRLEPDYQNARQALERLNDTSQ